MADQKYALLVDYTYFSGNHAAEIACKEEFELPINLYGIKEVEIGPFKLSDDDANDGDNWDWNYLPVPTSIFSKYYGTNGIKAGQRPLAVQVEESASLYYGTVEDMVAKMAEFDRPMCLFQL